MSTPSILPDASSVQKSNNESNFQLRVVPYHDGKGAAFQYKIGSSPWEYVPVCTEDLSKCATEWWNETYHLGVLWYLLDQSKTVGKTAEEYFKHDMEKWNSEEKIKAWIEHETKEVERKNKEANEEKNRQAAINDNFWKHQCHE